MSLLVLIREESKREIYIQCPEYMHNLFDVTTVVNLIQMTTDICIGYNLIIPYGKTQLIGKRK